MAEKTAATDIRMQQNLEIHAHMHQIIYKVK